MPLSTFDQRRHSASSTAKIVRMVCAGVSAARNALAAATIGAVETPVARMGNRPGVTPAEVCTPTNGCASAASCCSANRFFAASRPSFTPTCAPAMAASPAIATAASIHARRPGLDTISTSSRRASLARLSFPHGLQRLLHGIGRGVALGAALHRLAFRLGQRRLGLFQGGPRRVERLFGRLLPLLAQAPFSFRLGSRRRAFGLAVTRRRRWPGWCRRCGRASSAAGRRASPGAPAPSR